MFLKNRKILSDDIITYEIKRRLPDGQVFHQQVTFSIGEMAYRKFVARRLRQLRNDYQTQALITKTTLPVAAHFNRLVFFLTGVVLLANLRHEVQFALVASMN
ncbi:hypothetical protein PTE30175_04523 [Pandoraea terrae]|uniref:Uncharacterized protein n=1 Tax=Pandoraea terrae TaxID=1537710 RepID=A0A5E4YPJ8_9BURK|nr:hypothetical protein [Pandoraea terrae]VVE49863.1 hypothetical protein PTE30175_04523 [Pandoraea terrae]